MSKTDDVVKSYFRAWEEQNIKALATVFCPDATYAILPRSRTLRGLNEIQKYWARNARRQADFTVSWKQCRKHDVFARASFTASFFDLEEQRGHVITGIIDFSVDASGRVCHLHEFYSKILK